MGFNRVARLMRAAGIEGVGQCRRGVTTRRMRGPEAARSLHRFRDRLRVSCVVLAALDEKLHLDRGDQSHLVAERHDLTAPVVGAGARLHRHRTLRMHGEKAQ